MVVVATGGHKAPWLVPGHIDTKSQTLPEATMEIKCWDPP